jgi:hypothetical protein
VNTSPCNLTGLIQRGEKHRATEYFVDAVCCSSRIGAFFGLAVSDKRSAPGSFSLLSPAETVVGRPLPPVIVAGAARRTVRRCAAGRKRGRRSGGRRGAQRLALSDSKGHIPMVHRLIKPALLLGFLLVGNTAHAQGSTGRQGDADTQDRT